MVITQIDITYKYTVNPPYQGNMSTFTSVICRCQMVNTAIEDFIHKRPFKSMSNLWYDINNIRNINASIVINPFTPWFNGKIILKHISNRSNKNNLMINDKSRLKQIYQTKELIKKIVYMFWIHLTNLKYKIKNKIDRLYTILHLMISWEKIIWLDPNTKIKAFWLVSTNKVNLNVEQPLIST